MRYKMRHVSFSAVSALLVLVQVESDDEIDVYEQFAAFAFRKSGRRASDRYYAIKQKS